jgi:hypothetical protein
MEISKATIGFVAAACVVTGAAGAFLATRTGSGPAEPSAQIAAASPAVDASEGFVADPSVTPAPVAPASPARVTPPPARPASVPAARPAPTQAPGPTAQVESAPTVAAPIEAPIAPLPIESARVSESVPPPAPEPKYEDLELAAQSVIGLQLESSVTSETARVEDEVIARVTRDVRVGDRVAIPAGAKALGEVTLVERGARVRERARLAVRFTSIVLGDGTRLPIDTEPIYREGDSVRNENAAKIGGGAIGGAILGGILGGAKGAAIGGSIGAGAGTAAVVASGRNAASLPSGSPVTVRIERPVVVSVER